MDPLPSYEAETNSTRVFFNHHLGPCTNPPPTSTSHLPLSTGLVTSARDSPPQVPLPLTREFLGLCSLRVTAGRVWRLLVTGGAVPHQREQLLLPDRQGKFVLVEILSGHHGRPVATGPAWGLLCPGLEEGD